jgi:hypothetical protein
MVARSITREDIVHLFGEIDDLKVAEILATKASYEELEEALLWVADEDDVAGKLRKPLSGAVAQIYEIITRDEEAPEEPRVVR